MKVPHSVLVASPSMNQRRQPLLRRDEKRKKVGEMAGGAAAECAAVCCCCPFTVMNLLVLAVYKVPAGLCKKAWRKQRKLQRRAKRKQVGGLLTVPPTADADGVVQKQELLEHENKAASQDLDIDTQMWDQFHATGFWRSASSQSETHTHTE